MTERAIDKGFVVGALVEEWAAIGEFLGGLPDAQWDSPSPLPGWSVRDLVAHIVGTEASLSGESLPASEVDLRSLDHVRNDIGALNEAWVQSLRSSAPADVLARFRQLTGLRAAALEAMSQAESSTAGCTSRICATPLVFPGTVVGRAPSCRWTRSCGRSGTSSASAPGLRRVRW